MFITHQLSTFNMEQGSSQKNFGFESFAQIFQILNYCSSSLLNLNPIQNLWGLFVRWIYANRQYDSLVFKAPVLDAWSNISHKTIRSLSENM